GEITVFGGGGGTITTSDARVMARRGVDRIFFAGTSLDEIVSYVKQLPVRTRSITPRERDSFDRRVSLHLRAALKGPAPGKPARGGPPTIGVTGPGGAGKTTLIDELVLRFLKARPRSRIAIVSHDPSIASAGALLGDRATMIHSQNDQVFMRSLATRGRAGGLSPQTEPVLAALKRMPFDLIILETVGTGQEAMPFAGGLVDTSVFVMSPEYGSKLQLQKIAMLDIADVVVVNKGDLAGAPRATSEVEQRLHMNRRQQRVFTTQAKRHRDPGVDGLFAALFDGQAAAQDASPFPAVKSAEADRAGTGRQTRAMQ
ncbi:MAG: hypothetical protein NZ561_00175, partial [Phycisphaerae bacterium]|nr:hypothetical protein [Phycisphaerae bacterium]